MTSAASRTTIATVIGSAYPVAAAPAATSTTRIASGPYATLDRASSDSAASPPTTVNRSRSSLSPAPTVELSRGFRGRPPPGWEVPGNKAELGGVRRARGEHIALG